MKCHIKDDGVIKSLKSLNYNYIFNRKTGFFARWGATPNDDPDVAPFPEILDIEITTKCTGPGGKLCKFCYKGNVPQGDNMSFETFKIILDKFPKALTQIAVGADANATQNPDMWKMFDYCHENGIVPNITVADVDESTAIKLANKCGAVAVSRYDSKDLCYNSVERLVNAGLSQTNIHVMISQETYQNALDTIDDYITDSRLSGLRAIVFLSLKPKGRGEKFHSISDEQFKALVDKAFALNVPLGFDSCSAPKFMKSVASHKNYDKFKTNCESCESACMSAYVDVFGSYFPCSFTPGCNEWNEGIDVAAASDFVKDVWNHPKTKKFRKNLIASKDEHDQRNCPLYDV